MSSIVVAGDVSGSVTIAAPSAAGSTTLTLPSTSGTILASGSAVTAAQGGTGQTSLTANNVILGNGTSAVQFVAPGTNGNVLTSNGTTWASSAAPTAGTGPAFSAYINSGAQSLSLSTWTKITFNTEEFDTASCFDTTNYRFTPNVAGYYQVNACLFFDFSGSQFTDAAMAVYKNGSAVKKLNQYGYGGYGMGNVSALIYMNGTTDYLEVYGYISGGSGPQIYSNSSGLNTYVSAYLARSA